VDRAGAQIPAARELAASMETRLRAAAFRIGRIQQRG
jgi:hypothetical protein